MKSRQKLYKFCLWKAYFEKGYGITSYIKYLIAVFGLTSQKLFITLLVAVIYGFACLILGKLWFYYRVVDTEYEVQNRVNPFVRQMRRTHKIEKFK